MKKIHLICNAHIDPIWQWTWDEGISACISTFKSAVDLADEYDYIFCHNEALLYEEIEKRVPKLFAKIKKLVKQGKWVITGGWYIQPDCLMPNGESIVRQIEVGKKYFKEKFGVEPTIATNFDSFGHSIGLVQILKKCGYNGYLICRPNALQFDYPSKFFDWVGPDGSKIAVSFSPSYSSALGHAVDKISFMARGENVDMLGSNSDGTLKRALEDVDYVLWGVGNHGGGPSRKDLQDIKDYKIDGVEIVHSTPENLFNDNIRIGGKVNTSLVTCMPGCYTSIARIKAMHRETENLLYGTEKMLAVAKLCGYNPDLSDWEFAQKKLLFGEFHDILPGTVIKEGETDAMELFATANKIIKAHRTGAFLYLVMGDKVASAGEYPIFVFNYLPYEITTPIEVEFSLADQNWSKDSFQKPVVYYDGKILKSQCVKENSTLNLDWRKRVIFNGTLKPLSITRFSIITEETPLSEKNNNKHYELQNLLSKSKLLSEPITLEMYDDTADPWGMSNAELKQLGTNPKPFNLLSEKDSASFCGFNGKIAPIHTIEDGDIFTGIECLYGLNKTNAVVDYKFYKDQKYIDVKVIVEYGEKNKMIRLKIPAPNGITLGDGPYVVENKPKTGEINYQKWVGIKKPSGKIFSVINNCVYGGKVENGYIYITLLRGAGYCFHPIADRELYPKDRYLNRIESGRYEFNFRIMCGLLDEVCEEAQLFNEQPYALNIFPIGTGTKTCNIHTDERCVMPVLRIKDKGYDMRLVNTNSKDKIVNISFRKKKKTITIPAHQIVTVKLEKNILVDSNKIL